MDRHYDYIIVGAGCAGLSLVHHMLQARLDFSSMLIIDPSTKSTNDRTWCFWSATDFGYQSAQKQSWNSIAFLSNGFKKSQSIDPYTYYHIRSIDFYEEVLAQIASDPRIELIHDKLTGLESDTGFSTVITQDAEYRAVFVFNSAQLDRSWKAENVLFQHFYGQVVETKEDYFNPNEVYLMDFRMPNQEQVQFGYLLPFSRRKALVEYTEFSGSVRNEASYKDCLDAYLKTLGIKEFTIEEDEHGVIPMTSYSFDKSISTRIFNIGTAGGMTKPTTGYTFRNVQIDSQKIVKALKQGHKVLKRKATHRRFRFYDRLLLGIIRQEPYQVKLIMQSLFRRNQFARILRFLDEESSIWDEIRIFCSIPWPPFLRQLFQR